MINNHELFIGGANPVRSDRHSMWMESNVFWETSSYKVNFHTFNISETVRADSSVNSRKFSDLAIFDIILVDIFIDQPVLSII